MRRWCVEFVKAVGTSGLCSPICSPTKSTRCFVKDGIGWQLVDGEVQVRGPEAFEQTVRDANATLAEAGRETAAREIHEALQDLSRRPAPDLTGALQHGLAASRSQSRGRGTVRLNTPN